MARKVVNLTIRLKDRVSGVLGKIGRGMKALTGGFMKLAKVGMWAGGAIAGGLGAVAKAFADQESVNRKMKAAFDAAGDSGTRAVAKWGAWATAIQRVTALGDEEIMSTITLAKVMGVSNDKLKEATKGAIGLSKAYEMDLQTSMKYVALAMQGEYTMLGRYIPALRSATTESEKLAIVQETMANGFKLAEAELGTIKGEFAALKGVIGDALQEVGKVLFGDGGLAGGLALVKRRVIELIEDGAITRWAEQAQGAFDAVVQTVKILSRGGEGRSKVLQAIGKVLIESFKAAANGALNVLLKGAPKIGLAIGQGVMDVLGIVVTPESIKQKERQAEEYERKAIAATLAVGGSPGDEKAYQKVALEARGKAAQLRREIFNFWSGEMEIASTSGLEGALEGLKDVVNEFSLETDTKNLEDSLNDVGDTMEKSLESVADATNKGLSKAVLKFEKGPAEGGFAQMAEKMMSGGMSRRNITRQIEEIARLEREGRKAGIEGMGTTARGLYAQGLSRRDVSRRVGTMQEWETRGREAGFEGLGGMAGDLISQGLSGGALRRSMETLLESQLAGVDILGGDIDDPMSKTNELITEQNNILKERLGGIQ